MAADLKWTLIALDGARKLEKEGEVFYTNAAGRTANGNGKEMFRFLAGEEVRHYNVVSDLIQNLGGSKTPINMETPSQTGIFTETQGGKLGEKSDELDALNIGIQAERKSIETYTSIHEKTTDNKLKKAMKKLIDEEKKHLSILEKEVEFITETGEYHDFKTITM